MTSDLKNYSTSIEATKTVGEMQAILASNGAQRIAVDYTDGRPDALTFAVETDRGVRVFRLPVNIDAMQKMLIKREREGKLKTGLKSVRSSRPQAERVAWRIMKDWLQAQLALIESDMVRLSDVMLPYLLVDGGTTTLAQAWEQRELRELVQG